MSMFLKFSSKACAKLLCIIPEILQNVSRFNSVQYVSFFQDFVTGLSLSLYGSREEKMKWAFQLYDLDGDGCITREVC